MISLFEELGKNWAGENTGETMFRVSVLDSALERMQTAANNFLPNQEANYQMNAAPKTSSYISAETNYNSNQSHYEQPTVAASVDTPEQPQANLYAGYSDGTFQQTSLSPTAANIEMIRAEVDRAIEAAEQEDNNQLQGVI